MKHFIKAIALFCIGACSMVSCGNEDTPKKQEDPTLEVSNTELNFSQNVESKALSITTNGAWYVTNDSDWVSISPMGGQGNGTILVSVSQNLSGMTRESKFTVAIESESKVVTVSQSATDTPSGNPTGGNNGGEMGGIDGGDNMWNDGNDIFTLQPVLNAMEVKNVTAHMADFSDLLSVQGMAWYNIGSGSKVGFCLSTSANPTMEENSIYEKSIIAGGDFSKANVGVLNPNTTYYVRSYAVVVFTDQNDKSKTSTKTVYGNEVNFTTLAVANESYSYVTGAIEGCFSISANSKVAFSMGNLQYNAGSNVWRFAEHQYDIIGDGNSNISPSYAGYIDLFGWGTSGWNSGADEYQPYAVSKDWGNYAPGIWYYNNLTDDYANADWGVYNKISNGGNTAGMWRTLTDMEWRYIVKDRADAAALKTLATVNGVAGLVLLPDDWSTPNGITFLSGRFEYEDNVYTLNEWAIMEAKGAVFLPAAGKRVGSRIDDVGTTGDYWASTNSGNDAENAYCMNYRYGDTYVSTNGVRSHGRSVRLVRGL